MRPEERNRMRYVMSRVNPEVAFLTFHTKRDTTSMSLWSGLFVTRGKPVRESLSRFERRRSGRTDAATRRKVSRKRFANRVRSVRACPCKAASFPRRLVSVLRLTRSARLSWTASTNLGQEGAGIGRDDPYRARPSPGDPGSVGLAPRKLMRVRGCLTAHRRGAGIAAAGAVSEVTPGSTAERLARGQAVPSGHAGGM